MVLQLIVEDGERTLRFPLVEGEHLLGSDAECTLRVPHPAVSRRHARVTVDRDGARIEDLGSSNGTIVNGHRPTGAVALEVGASLRFGTLDGRVEEVEADDLEPAVMFERTPPGSTAAPAPGTTAAIGSVQAFTLQALPGLLARIERREAPEVVAQAVGAALFETLPCLQLTIARRGLGEAGVLFTADRGASAREPAAAIGEVGDLTLRAEFAHDSQARGFQPLIDAGARIVALARPAARRVAPPTTAGPAEPPDPPTVVERMRRLYREAQRVARGDVGVLITGESGTGKEVLARFLHNASPRCDAAFVALNCAALPGDLLESELFGVEKGVATGVEARAGKFELADRGTLLLDEIGDMAAETQAKILRVLQEGEVYRLGGDQPRPARVRVLAATNRDIQAMLRDGTFRTDLYHRIADWVVELPPLRERRADIPNLAAHFLVEESARRGVQIAGISKGAVEALQAHDWPGNVRQLQREMARAVLFVEEGELLQGAHLQDAIRRSERPVGTSLKSRLESVERRIVEEALAARDGDVAAAASDLDLGRSTLYRRIKELGIDAG